MSENKNEYFLFFQDDEERKLPNGIHLAMGVGMPLPSKVQFN